MTDWQLAYIEQEVKKQKLKEINSILLSACEKVLSMVRDPEKLYWEPENTVKFGEDCIDILNKAISKAKEAQHD